MGTSNTSWSFRGGYRDHPHAYGDKSGYAAIKNLILGSSPRVWGQDFPLGRGEKPLRIIPTRMGTRKVKTKGDIKFEDHPHAYGDKPKRETQICTPSGSSPRVWGQGSFYSCRYSVRGIIPTRMGTSQEQSCHCTIKQDHPHAYGDKFLWREHRQSRVGSSPRVWGQEVADKVSVKSARIIPTRMGTSS